MNASRNARDIRDLTIRQLAAGAEPGALGTPTQLEDGSLAYKLPRVRCMWCGVERWDTGTRCEECGRYNRHGIDAQDRRDYKFAGEGERQ